MDAYEKITQKIIERLENGVIPWQKPYRGIERAPMNFKSKKAYRGVNIFVLFFCFKKSPYWLSYKQAKELGGQVKKGTKGEPIVFAKKHKFTNRETGEEEERFFMRYSTVFNLDDIDGIDCPFDGVDEDIAEIKSLDYCENLIKDLQGQNLIPDIVEHNRMVAVYNFTHDVIKTPNINDYVSSEEYYSTLFHEITHSTGHKSRLDRVMIPNKETQAYAKEELIAEMGSCFMCNHVGFMTKTIENSAAYISMWISRLKNDPKMVVQAASAAQKVMDYLKFTDGKVYEEVRENGFKERIES